jgi:phosphoribosylamine--glycine ligase
VISGLDTVENVEVFHAGTTLNEQGDLVVNGGRVLCVTATGADLVQARRLAYAAVAKIDFAGAQHRSDIALAAAEGRIQLP